MTVPTDPESWGPIAGFESFYEVSTHGQVRAYRHYRHSLCPRCHQGLPGEPYVLGGDVHNGRHRVIFTRNRQRRVLYCDALVLTTFAGPAPTPEHCVRHLDDDVTNDRLDNLTWGLASKAFYPKADTLRALAAQGWPQKAIAIHFGVSQAYVSRTLKRIHSNTP